MSLKFANYGISLEFLNFYPIDSVMNIGENLNGS